MKDGMEILTGDISRDTVWVGRTPAGAHYAMSVRPGTSDWNTVNSCARPNDEYHLPTGLSGWALDVGAHIGACAVPLLIDNPDLRVIAIEALPENVDMLRANAARNQVSDRLIVLHGAAAGYGTTRVTIHYPADPEHRYIGNADHPGTPTLSADVDGFDLDALLAALPDAGRFVWAKVDCEACEYPLLSSARVDRIDHIEGEHHRGIAGIRERLEATHDVDITSGTDDFGTFRAVLRVAVPA